MMVRGIIRLLDIGFSLTALALLTPFFLVAIPVLFLLHGSPVFFSQTRSGRNFHPFRIYKFRTMKPNSEEPSGLTRGLHDERITRPGYFLRKYKLDELPQFVNILVGDMSVVGSRPQVPYYAERFRTYYDRILKEKPGLLSPAAIQFGNEEELLDRQSNPTAFYEDYLVPVKCQMDIELVQAFSVGRYISVLWHYTGHLFGWNRRKSESIS